MGGCRTEAFGRFVFCFDSSDILHSVFIYFEASQLMRIYSDIFGLRRSEVSE